MDALILGALADKHKYNSLKHCVKAETMGPETNAMLAWYGAYFTAFPHQDSIDVDELKSFIRVRSGNATAEQLQLTLHLAERLRERPSQDSINGMLGQLTELDLSGRLGALLERYNTGGEVELAYEANRLAQDAVRAKASATGSDYIITPISEILAEVADDRGLKFSHIAALREHIMGLQGGASVAIAARPDKGKTSFIAAALTVMAKQVIELYGTERPILWGNNEGSGKRIIPRIYQAALKMDLNQIIELSNAGVLEQEYTKAIGGVPNLIRVKDIHGANMAQIEQIIQDQRPALMVLDMIANVRMAGVAGGNKADAVEQLWQEWREICVRNDVVGLATVQISNEGGNMLYPPYSALKDSKTAVQGATDVIIMMGSLDNPDAQTIRGLSTPKNKFAMPGKPSCLQSEVFFDGSKCVFNDGATA